MSGGARGFGAPIAESATEQEPAVSIRTSIKPNYIVCLEDGKKLKMLKRHLMPHHQMTPDTYRAKWKLPPSYPLVVPNYSATRKALVLKIGLGRKAELPARTPVPVPAAPAPKSQENRAPR
jgi:predicted transcriptional regulator